MVRPLWILGTLIALIAAAGLLRPALAEQPAGGTPDGEPIKTRQHLMVEMIKATKVPRAMVRDGAPFDGAAVQAAMERVLAATERLPALFPEGSAPGSYTRPALLENRAELEARFAALSDAARAVSAASRTGAEALPAAYHAYATVCDSCHDLYRLPEEGPPGGPPGAQGK